MRVRESCWRCLRATASNKGQFIDISLLDSTLSTLTYQSLMYLTTGKAPGRMGTRHPSIVPYECFQVKDGFVNIGVTNQKQWTAFCRVLGLPDLETDPRFATMKERLAHYDALEGVHHPASVERCRVRRLSPRLSEVGNPGGTGQYSGGDAGRSAYPCEGDDAGTHPSGIWAD